MDMHIVVIASFVLCFGVTSSELLRFEPQKTHTNKHILQSVLFHSKDILCPDAKNKCSENSTCCKMDAEEYGCCLIKMAVCCSDGVHCCPAGMKCDVDAGTCVKSDSNGLYQELPAALIKDKKEQKNTVPSNIQCPGGYQCPDEATCCQLLSGQYACCPMPQAVCCEDHLHCCPNGYTCDVAHSKCNKAGENIEWSVKFAATVSPKTILEEKNLIGADIQCPDPSYQCPTESTCCKLPSGAYGCCPMPMAVCCEDHMHCCPNSYTCDVAHSKCNKNDESIEWIAKMSATVVPSAIQGKRNQDNDICPDQKTQCPSGTTCCGSSAGYGCCPWPQAACCEDQIHCCPNGYICDSKYERCHKKIEPVTSSIKMPRNLLINSIVCPDGQSTCDDRSTCCKLQSGDWGCCPLPQAVCCEDLLHCCPSGTTCDVAHSKCLKNGESIEWSKKTPAQQIPAKINVCPDGQSTCNDGSTCCKLQSGDWGCCPLPQAVCCEDMLHCCPSGTTCDVAHSKCLKNGESIEWSEKTPAQMLTKPTWENVLFGYNVICTDKRQCADGQTCCEMKSGKYGCCDMPNAVCCEDKASCCPNGYTCDVAHRLCHPKDSAMKAVMSATSELIGNVPCDAQSYCQDGQTCCKLASGSWGCCPYPQAECCSDHASCCPNGYSCDVPNKRCNPKHTSMELLASALTELVGNVPCDAQSYCQDGQTCCKLASGSWGCCPYPQAACCSDGASCCPNGYTCDVAHQMCNPKNGNGMSIAISTMTGPVGNVPCDDTSYCQDGQTCCKLASGSWGCCPYPKAVCCSDGASCCPNGYTCDVAHQMCNPTDVSVNLKPVKAAIRMPTLSSNELSIGGRTNTDCPDKSTCSDDSTCCQLSDGHYACCPLQDAVCCEDHLHCCPSGTTCNIAELKCESNGGQFSFSWYMARKPAVMKPKVESTELVGNVPCDAQSYCQDGQTCCKLASGSWGCCPYPQAVCCSDGASCCPNGYTCDVAKKMCNPKDTGMKSLSTSAIVGLVSNVPCDAQSYCQDGQTCCKLASGSWGCCSYPQAVCCSDGASCCPNGYTCDVAQKMCNPKTTDMAFLTVSIEVGRVSNVQCDDESYCPDGHTCCKLTSGNWGCCPYPQAVCCSDGASCCPNGYTCDVAHQMCNPKNGNGMSIAISTMTGPVGNVPCDDTSYCQDGQTCCKLASGSWGCCPYPKAVCCSDGASCCPNGYTCDVAHHLCNPTDVSVNLKPMKAASRIPTLSSNELSTGDKANIDCPDKSSCSDDSTCCQLSDGHYACCPLQNAVCCEDHLHCCPSGTTCNIAELKCESNGGQFSFSWYMARKPAVMKAELSTVPCGYRGQCKKDATCCSKANGHGCCDMPGAVCCSDGTHCCPSGTQCDITNKRCVKNIPWSNELAAQILNKNANCCDHQHCCPAGCTCNLEQKICVCSSEHDFLIIH